MASVCGTSFQNCKLDMELFSKDRLNSANLKATTNWENKTAKIPSSKTDLVALTLKSYLTLKCTEYISIYYTFKSPICGQCFDQIYICDLITRILAEKKKSECWLRRKEELSPPPFFFNGLAIWIHRETEITTSELCPIFKFLQSKSTWLTTLPDFCYTKKGRLKPVNLMLLCDGVSKLEGMFTTGM